MSNITQGAEEFFQALSDNGLGSLWFTAGIVISYMIGNISPAIILGKIYGVDIKKSGSGNAGTTNVLRVIGKKAAVITLVTDILKGVIPVVLGTMVGGGAYGMVCGFAAFLGHIFPALHGFRGGKGVATAFGVILSVNPAVGGIVAAIAVIIILLTRRVSVGALIAATAFPFIAYAFNPMYLVWAVVIAIFVIAKHHQNIGRILRGEESKLSFKKK